MAESSRTDATGVTLVGLDGVSWELVEELRDNADIPTLERLVSESAHGVTKSTIPSLTCPALPTLYTGKNPGNLGIFDFVKPDGSIVDYHDIIEPAVWDYLTEEGLEMIVGAMRTTHPAPEINGVFISDVLSPTEEPHYVTPASDREYGDRYHRLRDELEAAKEEDDKYLLETFIEMNNERAEVFLDLLRRDEPDFALLWFGLSDGVQHYFWDDRRALYEFFEAFDDRLAAILDARSDTNILLVGDHGFGPAIKYRFHLNEALRRAGLLELEGSVVREKFTETMYAMSERFVSDAWKRVGLELVNWIRTDDDPPDKTVSSRQVISPLDTLPGIDWSRTVAHTSTRKGWGINIQRENIDRDYEEVRNKILGVLDEIEAPDGNPAIKDAWRGERIYWGQYADQVPDIVFLTNDLIKVRPSVTGSLFSPISDGNYVGSHESSRDAVFIASGPDVDCAGHVGDVNLYDIVPTVFWLLGIPIPDNLDGRPVVELSDGTSLRDVPVDSYPVERYRIRTAVDQVARQDVS